MEKWYSQNPEIVEAKVEGSVAAAFAVLMGTMGLWQAVEKYNADPQEIEKIIEENSNHTSSERGGRHWDQNQVQEWNRLNSEQINPQQNKKEFKNPSKTNEKESSLQNKKINLLARIIYKEAGGESSKGRQAVATVLWNRANGNPERLDDVIMKKHQFESWSHLKKELGDDFSWDTYNPSKEKNITTNSAEQSWEECVDLATQMINGNFQPISDWDHFVNLNVAKPSWAYEDESKTKIKPHTRIGNHWFMNL